MLSALKDFTKSPILVAVLVLIFLSAAFFRFWGITDSFHFLGDQGRDALTVSKIFTDKDLVFIGPVTSVGNMYLGPFYYYFMLPFLWLSYPSPVGPVLAVALLNVITVILVYHWGQEMIGKRAAVIGSFLMACSSTAVYLSRFSWNPNITPFFSLLLIYSSFRAWKSNVRWWIVAGFAFSVLLQLHYVTLLAGAAAGVIWLVQLVENKKDSKNIRKIIISSVLAGVVVIVSMVPLLLFDYKHDWSNFKALQSLVGSDENFAHQTLSHTENLVKVIKETHGRSMHIFFEITIGKNRTLNTWLVIAVVAIVSQFLIFQRKNLKEHKGLIVLLVFLIVSIFGLSFYEHNVFDHYIAYLFPATFLVLGFCLARLSRVPMLGWLVVSATLLYYAQYNFTRIDYQAGGPSQADLKIAADAIHQRVESNEPYNVILLSESGDLYGMNYRYFLSTDLDKRPVNPEDHHRAKKLFVINEDKKSNDPQNLPIYEIVVFENKQPVEEFTLENGLEITVLSAEDSQ